MKQDSGSILPRQRRVGGGVLILVILAIVAIAPPPAADDNQPPPVTEMIFIAGGEFLMGKDGYADHSPAHQVRIDPFYLERHEVTNAQYLAFCTATEHKLPEYWEIGFHSGPDYPDHPVIGISWSDAVAYARWRDARLPTEAEWEYAARGGLAGMNYSHGDTLTAGLYAKSDDKGPIAVASCPPNGFGLHDMTRNVVEWVHDWYGNDYYRSSPVANPTGPGHGRERVIRGGGWHTGPYCSRVYYRHALKSNWLDYNVGFRCARYKGESAARELERIIGETGIGAALTAFGEMQAAEPGTYYLNETELNNLSYTLLGDEQVAEAIEILSLVVATFPHSYNAHDSLGEAYKTAGERELAIQSYRRSVELNPANGGGHRALEELEQE